MQANISSAKSCEWYTPPEYIQLARYFLGGEIDLDPASSLEANEIVGASRIYTQEEDGLKMPWEAKNIFCNPPYSYTDENGKVHKCMNDWTEKIFKEFSDKKQLAYRKRLILLVNANVGTAWFSKLLQKSTSVCFVNKRIRFLSPAGAKNSPVKGNAFFLFSAPSLANDFKIKEYNNFKRCFSSIGACYLTGV